MKHVWIVIRAAVVIGCCFAPAVAQMVSHNSAGSIMRDEFEHVLETAGHDEATTTQATGEDPFRAAAPGRSPDGARQTGGTAIAPDPCAPSPAPDYLADHPNPACLDRHDPGPARKASRTVPSHR